MKEVFKSRAEYLASLPKDKRMAAEGYKKAPDTSVYGGQYYKLVKAKVE